MLPLRQNPYALRKLAHNAPETHPFREVLASWEKAASLLQDKFCRASFFEGLLGLKPNSIVRNPEPWFRRAQAALDTGESDDLLDALRVREATHKDIELMVGRRDLLLFEALVSGAAQAMPKEGVRGHLPEDVAQSLAAGFSVLTGDPLRYGPGKGVFYHLGFKWHGTFTIRGLAFILRREAKNRAADVVRGTRKEDSRSKSIDSPAYPGSDDAASLSDILSGDSAVSEGAFVDIASAVYNDPKSMALIDEAVRAQLSGPVQVVVWEAIRDNPSLLKITSKGIGVEQRALALAVSEASGSPYKGDSSDIAAGMIFRGKVLPAMTRSFQGDEALADVILQDRYIMETLQEATSPRRASLTQRVVTRYLARCQG